MIATADQIKTREEKFLELLPKIREMAAWAFRRCPREAREEAVAEVMAHAWKAFLGLMDRGLERRIFATPLAKFAIQRVRAGRGVGCARNVNDLSSPYAQRQHGIRLERLDSYDERTGTWRQMLLECPKAGPAETAAARIDFADWLQQMPRRMRRIAELLALGETTGRVARRFRLSTGRISQMRRELKRGWDDFQAGTMPA
jgi:hypothetical protein